MIIQTIQNRSRCAIHGVIVSRPALSFGNPTSSTYTLTNTNSECSCESGVEAYFEKGVNGNLWGLEDRAVAHLTIFSHIAYIQRSLFRRMNEWKLAV